LPTAPPHPATPRPPWPTPSSRHSTLSSLANRRPHTHTNHTLGQDPLCWSGACSGRGGPLCKQHTDNRPLPLASIGGPTLHPHQPSCRGGWPHRRGQLACPHHPPLLLPVGVPLHPRPPPTCRHRGALGGSAGRPHRAAFRFVRTAGFSRARAGQPPENDHFHTTFCVPAHQHHTCPPTAPPARGPGATNQKKKRRMRYAAIASRASRANRAAPVQQANRIESDRTLDPIADAAGRDRVSRIGRDVICFPGGFKHDLEALRQSTRVLARLQPRSEPSCLMISWL